MKKIPLDEADSALSGVGVFASLPQHNKIGLKNSFRAFPTIWDSIRLLCTCMALFVIIPAADAAEVTTDKPDYMPRSTAVFSGSGFNVGENVEVHVTFADGSMMVDGDAKWQVATDAAGAFTTTWTVCNCPEASLLLTVTGQSSGLVATVNFTDGAVNLDQFANDKATDDPTVGSWQNGDLNPNNAHFVEGYSVPYRLILAIPEEYVGTGEIISFTLAFDTKHGGKHAFDFLTNYQSLNDPHHNLSFGHDAETVNPLLGLTFPGLDPDNFDDPSTFDTTGVDEPSKNTLVDAKMQPLQCFNDSPSEKSITIWGGTFLKDDIDPAKDHADAFSYEPALFSLENDAQGEQQFTVQFKADNDTVVLAWGGHIARQKDCWEEDPSNPGEPWSASGISGSPYHMRVIDWNIGNLGQQDRSLKASAVEAPDPPAFHDERFCVEETGILRVSDPDPNATYEWVFNTDASGNPQNGTGATFDSSYTGPNLSIFVGDQVGAFNILVKVNGVPVDEFAALVFPLPDCSISGKVLLCPSAFSESYSAGPEDTINPFFPDIDVVISYSYDWSIEGNAAINGAKNQPKVDVDAGSECANSFTLKLTVYKIYTNPATGLEFVTCPASCEKVVSVDDTEDPVLSGKPANFPLECGDPLADPEVITATDNCASNPLVTYTQVPEDISSLSCGDTIKRTWSVQDDCGGSDSHTQTITLTDTTNPVLSGKPANFPLECGDPLADPEVITATDNCASNPLVTYIQVPEDISSLSCGDTIKRTWSVKDDCGGSDSHTQTITLTDTTAPVLSSYPADLKVQCGSVQLLEAEVLTATDNCAKDLSVEYTQIPEDISNLSCGGIIKRTWRVQDGCDGVDTHTQKITIVDDLPPVITSLGVEHEAVCVIEGDLSDMKNGDTISIVTLCKCVKDEFKWGDVEASDDCGDVKIEITDAEPVVITKEYGEQKLYTRTIVVTDDCDNKITVTVNVYLPACPLTYLTLTQGGWSAPKRKKAGKGNNDKTNGTLRDLIVEVLLTKYGPLWIGKSDGNYVKVEKDERKYLRVLLPGGGPAAPLPDGMMVDGISLERDELTPLLNRNGRFGNVLIGQYVALQLNVWLNDWPEAAGEPLLELDPLGDHVLTPKWCSIPAGAFRKCESISSPADINVYFHKLNIMKGAVDQDILDALDAEGLPKTVNGLLELTRRYLAGHAVGGVSGSDLVSALSSFNEGFHGGRIWIDPILCECLQGHDE